MVTDTIGVVGEFSDQQWCRHGLRKLAIDLVAAVADGWTTPILL